MVLDIGEVPGVGYSVDMVSKFVSDSAQMLAKLVQPYASVAPVFVILLLFLIKFLVTLPLALKQGTDKCKNTGKFCGNTFSTFRGITQTLIAIFAFVLYTVILAGGFRSSGFFSVAAWTPFVVAVVVSSLALWAVQVTKLGSFNAVDNIGSTDLDIVSIMAAIDAGPSSPQEFLTGSKVYADYTLWHLIQKETFENFKFFSISTNPSQIFLVTVAAAVLTLANQYKA